MPNYQLGDTEKAPYVLTELDGASQQVPTVSTDVVSFTTDSPGSLTFVPDVTPTAGVASGFIFGGTPKISCGVTVTVTHVDGTSLSVTDLIDVVGGVASSLSLGLGAPVPK
jgi:hypothetical protein